MCSDWLPALFPPEPQALQEGELAQEGVMVRPGPAASGPAGRGPRRRDGPARPGGPARCRLLAEVERRLGLAERLARCLTDPRAPERVRHTLAEMIRFRVLSIAAGYPDANDRDPLRVDPAFEMAGGLCAWLAGQEVPGLRGVRPDARRGGIGDYDPHAALGRR